MNYNPCNIDSLVTGKEVITVIRGDGTQLTLDEYQLVLKQYSELNYGDNYIKITDFLAEDKIVGKDWWYVFTAVCCGDPDWYYYQHPLSKS